MSSEAGHCLFVTAAWDEIIGQGGFRTLTVETDPLVQRVSYGAWGFEQNNMVRIRVQLLDRTKPTQLSRLQSEMVNLTTFPSLRRIDDTKTLSSEHLPVSPFEEADDTKLREGLELEEISSQSTPMSSLYRPKEDAWFPLRYSGKFDFTVGLRVFDTEAREWRVFRTDPEMNVEPSQRHAEDEPPPKIKERAEPPSDDIGHPASAP